MSPLQLVPVVGLLIIFTLSSVKGINITLLLPESQLSISLPFTFEFPGAPIDAQQEIDVPEGKIYYQLFTR